MDYTDAMVLMQMISGLADDDIQRKILGEPDKTLKEAETFVIAEESGKWSQLESKSELQMATGLSNYKNEQLQKKKQCSTCGNKPHGKDGICPASEAKCRKCDRVGHYGRVCRSKKDNKSGKEENNALMVEELYELKINSVGDKVKGDPTREGLGRGVDTSPPLPGRPSKWRNNVLPHMVFNKKLGRYVAKKGGSAKMMDLQITLDKERFERLTPPGARLPSKSTMTSTPGTGDTGHNLLYGSCYA